MGRPNAETARPANRRPPRRHPTSADPAPPAAPPTDRDRSAARAVVRWFRRAARDLPWRRARADGTRDPYRALVSEFMLQQTQVSRVLDKYTPFLERFPDAESLARADERDVLAAWSGLGYYRRARMLHAAARDIVNRFNARVPDDPDTLRTIPGIGRYTAGAIASMVFGKRAPLVDGNVARVLLRLEGRELAPPDGAAWAWRRVPELLDALPRTMRPGELNEGLMELGATVCTPRNPSCLTCPLRDFCCAARDATQNRIPAPKPAAPRRPLWCASAVVRDGRGRVLLERRPDTGLWGGLWQAPTLEREDRAPRRSELARYIGVPTPAASTEFAHATTHREVRFAVFDTGRVTGADTRRLGASRTWTRPPDLATLALSNAQKRVLAAAGIEAVR